MSGGPQAALVAYLDTRRAWVEEALHAHLPHGHPQPLFAAMEHRVLAPGDRIHPILVVAAAEAVGGDGRASLGAAAAVEMAWGARRSIPQAESVDARLATLAADALLALAFELLAIPHVSGEPEARLAALHDLARCTGCGGTAAGLAASRLTPPDKAPTLPELEFIHTHTEGTWLTTAVRIGALLAGATPEALEAITRYGHHAGLAAAITADLNADAEAPAAPPRPSYTRVMGESAARDLIDELIERAVADLAPFGAPADPLRGVPQYLTGGAH